MVEEEEEEEEEKVEDSLDDTADEEEVGEIDEADDDDAGAESALETLVKVEASSGAVVSVPLDSLTVGICTDRPFHTNSSTVKTSCSRMIDAPTLDAWEIYSARECTARRESAQHANASNR